MQKKPGKNLLIIFQILLIEVRVFSEVRGTTVIGRAEADLDSSMLGGFGWWNINLVVWVDNFHLHPHVENHQIPYLSSISP